jgi:hypothetical protein
MEDIFAPIGTFFGYFWRGLLLVIVALIYLPAFVITTFLNKPFQNLLEEFGF